MIQFFFSLWFFFAASGAGPLVDDLRIHRETVDFPSGTLVLHGDLYRPPGTGPFPALLYNHGSAPAMENRAAAEILGPLFAGRGWIFFMPYRRGQGLSASAGRYILDEVDSARKKGGADAADETLTRLLVTEQLADQRAAYAWLRSARGVDPKKIAAAGNSFGGIETMLGVAQEDYCAGVNAAGASESWAEAPRLRHSMTVAARSARAPVFFFQARNDFDLTPSRVLYGAMKKAGKPSRLKIYPAFGTTRKEGHSFPYRGSRIWFEDVLRFLRLSCATS